MKENISKLLNEQINKELYSAYLYLSFSNYYIESGLAGFAHWYQIQAQEERDHAMLMVQYLQNNEKKVTFETIEKPQNTWADGLEVLKTGLAHEKFITDSINTIYHTASEERDYRTVQFLDWFVKEQGEEETNVVDIIKKMELFGSDPKGLYMLDKELVLRVYAAPSLVL